MIEEINLTVTAKLGWHSMSGETEQPSAGDDDLTDMIAETDTGGRSLPGMSAQVLWGVPLA